jgi:predicted transcriptional regulator
MAGKRTEGERMAQQQAEPAYRLDVAKFEQRLKDDGVTTAQFVAASGIADRTLSRIRAGEHDVTMPNVRRILSTIPGAKFEDFFEPNRRFDARS